MKKPLIGKKGFTLIEMVMVILLIGILAAVAIPNFVDFRTEARNAATQAALGGIRASVAVARSAIALKEATTAPVFPTLAEMTANAYDVASHPVLNGSAPNSIMDASGGIPPNPWSRTSIATTSWNTMLDCSALAKGALIAAPPGNVGYGWCYNANTGETWANTANNGAGVTENNY